jgi:hypothetical protein
MTTDEVMLPVPELEPAMPKYDVLWNEKDEDGNTPQRQIDSVNKAHTEEGKWTRFSVESPEVFSSS